MSKDNKRIIIVLTAIAVFAIAFKLGEYYGRPKCDDLVRDKFNNELVCEYGLGNTQEDSVNIIMKGEGIL